MKNQLRVVKGMLALLLTVSLGTGEVWAYSIRNLRNTIPTLAKKQGAPEVSPRRFVQAQKSKDSMIQSRNAALEVASRISHQKSTNKVTQPAKNVKITQPRAVVKIPATFSVTTTYELPRTAYSGGRTSTVIEVRPASLRITTGALGSGDARLRSSYTLDRAAGTITRDTVCGPTIFSRSNTVIVKRIKGLAQEALAGAANDIDRAMIQRFTDLLK